MKTKFQKITCFEWLYGDLNPTTGKYNYRGWKYKETKALASNSTYSQSPGLYIDKDVAKAFRYSDFFEDIINIPENMSTPTIDLDCHVYYRYEIREYNNINCEGEYTTIYPNLICECIENCNVDCYDKLLNGSRIPLLGNCIQTDNNKSRKTVVIAGPFDSIQKAKNYKLT